MDSGSKFPQVAEIISIICEYLASNKSTLASLARTSKLFEEPALDVLWHDQCGLANLVKCLPAHVYQQDEKGLMTLTQPLVSKDCSRYLHYSKRVKYFTFTQLVNEPVNTSVYHALQLALRGEKLLPNVRRLSWQCAEETVPIVPMFLGPLLTKVEFNLSPEITSLELSLFSALPEYCPQLKNVSLMHISLARSWTGAQKQALELMSSSIMIHKWENLKSLEIPFLGYSGIQKVARLPLLENLKVQRCKFNVGDSSKFPKGGFPTLDTLQVLGCARHTDCVVMLKFIDKSPLSSIIINFDETVLLSTHWAEIISTLSQQCRKDTLLRLEIKDKHNGVRGAIVMRPRQEMVQFEALEPLLTFPNLSDLKIGSYKGVYFSDPIFIKQMATSWPRLINLTFVEYTYTRSADSSSISIVDLAHFATNCPRLKTLWIGTFDATSPPVINQKNVYWDRTHTSPLQCLPVSDSPIKEPGQVAAFLSGIFPRLTQIRTIEESDSNNGGGPPSGDNHNAWKEVEKLIGLFSAVRAQERSLPV